MLHPIVLLLVASSAVFAARPRRALDGLDGSGFGFDKRALNSLDGAGFGFEKRALNSLDGQGFGFEKRALDGLDGMGFGFDKRALNSLDGAGFGFEKRALDGLDGAGFGFDKRALNSLDGQGFGFEKRALNSLDGAGFGFEKRALDGLDGAGFGFDKRALNSLDGAGFGFEKRALDGLDGAGFGFDKRALNSLDGQGFGFDKRSSFKHQSSKLRSVFRNLRGFNKQRESQIANGWTAHPKPESKQKPLPASSESRKDYLERIRRMNYREMQKERLRDREKERQRERQERIDRGEEKKPRQTLTDKFATSLGLPSKSSTHNPRHVLDMKAQVDSVDNQAKKLSDEERKNAVQKKLRTMLLRLEGALVLLMEAEELRRTSSSDKSQFKDLTSEEKEQEVEKRTSLIVDEFMGDDLPKLMQMSKGRAVITRTLKVVGPRDQARIILALMTAGGLVSKKMYGEIVLDILPVVHQKVSNLHPDQFKYLVGALNLDNLKRQLMDSNMFVRDVMLTLYLVSVKNNQNLLEWSKQTKFSSLKMPSSAPLGFWRKALSAVSDAEITEFAEDIKYSGVVDCHEVAKLIEQSL